MHVLRVLRFSHSFTIVSKWACSLNMLKQLTSSVSTSLCLLCSFIVFLQASQLCLLIHRTWLFLYKPPISSQNDDLTNLSSTIQLSSQSYFRFRPTWRRAYAERSGSLLKWHHNDVMVHVYRSHCWSPGTAAAIGLNICLDMPIWV